MPTYNKKEVFVTYYKQGTGMGKYHATLSVSDGYKRLTAPASGTFPSVKALKDWAKLWAKKYKAIVKYEKVG